MDDTDGAAAFVRRYAKTWVNAVATAAMTAFGTLTVVDTRFAALARAAYVLPPVLLYPCGTDGLETAERDRGTGKQGAWRTAPVPTGAALHDAAVGEGGIAIADTGKGWTVAFPDGPGANGATLWAATVVAAARAAELAVFRLTELGYDPLEILSATGSAPVAPVAGDEETAMARTNDALAYGGQAHLTVDG